MSKPTAPASAATPSSVPAAAPAAATSPSAAMGDSKVASNGVSFLESVGFGGKKPVTAVESKDGRIITKIKKAIEEKRPFYSFEYFPPKTDDGVTNLYSRVDRMAALQPMFMDVTWGAGGSTADLTLEISSNIQNYCSAEVMMHLTCTNMPVAKVREALVAAKERGIRNILALRGDPPKGAETWEACADGFAYAVDLVKFIRQEFGDYFGIAVAGYPEGHVSCTSLEDDLRHLKAKMDAGADFIVTQLFYDVGLFLEFVKKARAIGITQPIIPGIMPIQNYTGFQRMTGFCKTFVPKAILDALEPIKHDDARIKQYGIELGIQMCKELLAAGVPGLHFYTLNLERSVVRMLAGLGFVKTEQHTPMPWQKSKLQHRANETVRPVFWKHRPQSYLTRTTTWDEFPNGRWGDARSPAFGDLADYHLCGFKTGKASERVQIWGAPTKFSDVVDVFVGYLEGKVPRLPWCENQPNPETLSMKQSLVAINQLGYLTINSQPRVNGAPSTDPCVGWGAPGGVVYQKAYLEFFTSPQNLEKFIAAAKHFPMLTYHAINMSGQAHTNITAEKRVNAVTWGVWPTSEILQPTVVDPVSFVVWKEEAYALFQSQWISAHPKGSAPAKFLTELQNTYFLVNVVDNDFLNGDIFAVFDLIAHPNKKAPAPNAFFADQVPKHQDSDDEHY